MSDVIAKLLLLLLDILLLNLHKKKEPESDISQEKVNNKVVIQIVAEGGSCLELWRSQSRTQEIGRKTVWTRRS